MLAGLRAARCAAAIQVSAVIVGGKRQRLAASRESRDQGTGRLSGAKPGLVFADRVSERPVRRSGVLCCAGARDNVMYLHVEPGGGTNRPKDLGSGLPERLIGVAEPQGMTRQPCSRNKTLNHLPSQEGALANRSWPVRASTLRFATSSWGFPSAWSIARLIP